ncbi:MAG: fumarylacetoacetate hydrolase, partial [Proteobacteria bacterium]|nr:fumarylacetoacetate hydrolase [Pseudomonadota bacterium]
MELDLQGTFVGRVWLPAVAGPSLVALREGVLVDITSSTAPTMRDLLELDDPVGFVRAETGSRIGRLEEVLAASGQKDAARLLAPCDLQAIKACGVTFARSMIERVIEERAAGDPVRAAAIRDRVAALVGASLRDLKAGSAQAVKVKAALVEEGLWSQYLEVGIGPDAEVFTKAQVLSSVGHGAEVGLHPISSWNN